MSNQDEAVPQEQPAPEAWRSRVEVEYEELSAKLDKLEVFLDEVEGGTKTVDPITRTLLISQHGIMTAYKGILAIRLNARVQVQ